MAGTARLPRDLHPVAWWAWALGLAAAASFTTNPLLLLLIVGVAAAAVALRRSDQPWADSFRLYVLLGVAIVVVRVVFRLVFGTGVPGTVLIELPEIGLPDWAAGIVLLGPVTRESLLAGLYEGLRLAAIVICVGAANALANPKRLLRSVPPALYEVGTALVVAVTMLPQFADSVRRVRAAQSLRGGDTGRVRRLRRFLVPVLEDALERSLAMAAGMDARGYGRSGTASTPAASAYRRPHAARPDRPLRRHLRRARPDRAALSRRADAGRRPGRGRARASSAPARACSAPATDPIRGSGPRSRWCAEEWWRRTWRGCSTASSSRSPTRRSTSCRRSAWPPSSASRPPWGARCAPRTSGHATVVPRDRAAQHHLPVRRRVRPRRRRPRARGG